MSESAKALLGGAIFLLAIATFGVWFAVDIPSNPLVWSMRIGFPLLILAAIAALRWATHRLDRAPDFFKLLGIRPFERDGVCFSISADAANGFCRLNVLFQNQYANDADLRLVIRSPANNFLMTRRDISGLNLDIKIFGGGVMLVQVPMGVPPQSQGQMTRLEVSAATRYENGKGDLLRYTNGLRAGRADATDLGRAASTAAFLAIGVISVHKPASTKIMLPSSVSENANANSLPETATIWRSGDSTEKGLEKLNVLLTGPA